ncbi:hypothetical protein B005_0037 [Nocardiopsis alba ATCC BAA-2165]|uniref:Uncharacterized protein n=1 Tax=Nocardiopsis alba (strain ATCC BAA-2165 / BE74) TaxID=1205910 RepID=J7L4P9_NOCAA|nr:hypothetical protein B005_0037 [Nocardiopsis alba ATCC BAA-2165]
MSHEDVSPRAGALLRGAVRSTAQHRCREILNTVVLFIIWIAGIAAQKAM